MTFAHKNNVLSPIGTDPDCWMPIELQKLMFIFSQEECQATLYEFVSYQKGCYSSSLAADIHKLAEQMPFDFKYEITDEDGKTFTHQAIGRELNVSLNQKKSNGIEGTKQYLVKNSGEEFLLPNNDFYLFMGTKYKPQRWNVTLYLDNHRRCPFSHVETWQMELLRCSTKGCRYEFRWRLCSI